MKNLVRGAVILSLLSLFVIFIYAQVQTEEGLSSANDSQFEFNTNNSLVSSHLNLRTAFNNSQVNSNKTVKTEKAASAKESEPINTAVAEQDKERGNKVEKTVLSKAINKAAAISRGAFVATAYCLRGRTAMGHSVRSGLIAADPRILRLGSKVVLDAGNHSGQYLVSDTGGGIKGKRIDIWMASCADAKRFGRRTVNIGVLQ